MLRIINEFEVVIDTRDWQFNRRNVNRLAHEYDATVKCWEPQIKSATLKDSRGRLLWVVVK